MSLEREVLANRSEARQKRLRAIRIAEATHPTLAVTRRLMAIFGTVVHPCTGFDEDVFDVCQFGDFGLRGRITAQLIGDTALKQQFFNIAQAEMEPEVPPYRVTDDRRRKPVAVIKRFRSRRHRIMLREHPANVTAPLGMLAQWPFDAHLPDCDGVARRVKGATPLHARHRTQCIVTSLLVETLLKSKNDGISG